MRWVDCKNYFANLSANLFRLPYFSPPSATLHKLIPTLAVVIIYLIGAFVWSKLLAFGDTAFRGGDWLALQMYATIGIEAFRSGTLPLHVDGLVHGTNRFLASPELNFWPQAWLLSFLPPCKFFWINALVMYSAGFLGCVWIKRRLDLGLCAFFFLLLGSLFNGSIVSHIAVGHPWYGNFLLPLFCFLVIELLDQTDPKQASVLLASTMAVIGFAGSIHTFIGCLITIGLIAATRHKRTPWLLLSSALACGLLAVKMIPAGLSISPRFFEGGYQTAFDLVQGLLILRTPDTTGYYPWELDCFIGLVGVVILALFVGHGPGRCSSDAKRSILVAMSVLTLMSLNQVFKPLQLSHIPLLSAERVTTRFVVFPITFALIIACWNMQTWLSRTSSSTKRFLLLCGIFAFASDLISHASDWTIEDINKLPAARAMDYGTIKHIIVERDAPYEIALQLGVTISVLTLGVSLALNRPTRKQNLTCSGQTTTLVEAGKRTNETCLDPARS